MNSDFKDLLLVFNERGVEFDACWARRVTEQADGVPYQLVSKEDLIDQPMLIERSNHIQQNAQAYVPKTEMKAAVAASIRRVFDAQDRPEAENRIAELVKIYEKRAPKLVDWAEENLPEGLAVLALSEPLRKRLRTSKACENLNMQIGRRTRVCGLFPNEASLLGLATAVVMDQSDEWETGKTYLKKALL